jgi:hypothetical protein
MKRIANPLYGGSTPPDASDRRRIYHPITNRSYAKAYKARSLRLLNNWGRAVLFQTKLRLLYHPTPLEHGVHVGEPRCPLVHDRLKVADLVSR